MTILLSEVPIELIRWNWLKYTFGLIFSIALILDSNDLPNYLNNIYICNYRSGKDIDVQIGSSVILAAKIDLIDFIRSLELEVWFFFH